MSNLSDDMKKEIIDEIESLSKKLGGEYLHQSLIDIKGNSAKRILITYDNDLL
tara:strand:+ start:385 stop:543 length:159 start_codon:yes stop_codon:yes gene_type:complete